MSNNINIKRYQKILDDFAKERAWVQFHTPKNLVMALTSEIGELTELFQWLNEEESRNIVESTDDMKLVEEEIADIFIYLIRLSDVLNIDIDQAIENKIKINIKKYPIDLSYGSTTKYNRRK